MTDYISREAALDVMCDSCSARYSSACISGDKCYSYGGISNIPAADVVSVVRCKDCKHYNAGFECLIEGYGIERPADYFCADGERKNGGQDG